AGGARRSRSIGRRLRGQAPFLAVVTIVAAAFGYLLFEPGHWRRGTVVIAAAMLLAGVLRLVVSRSRAGWLVVRGRWWDAFYYLSLGALILLADLRLHS
ncbi:MAG: DUF3017 domain-containing protein, partial [Actinomycetota bacterium]|nr:DUF3017 domain-containing protein [Actinomycetota bacterium]